MPGCAENMNHTNPITEQGLGNALLGALTLDFDSVFVVDCETEEILPVHVSENYQRDFGAVEAGTKFHARVEYVASMKVYEQDRENFRRLLSRAHIAAVLAKSVSFSFRFQLVAAGEPLHYECRVVRMAECGGHAQFMIALRCVEALARHEQEALEEDRLHMMASNFKADVSTYLIEHGDPVEVEDFIARRLQDYFRCPHVLLHRADGSCRDWCAPDVRGGAFDVACRDCSARRTPLDLPFGEDGQLRYDDVAAGGFKLSAECPATAFLARQIQMDGAACGMLVVAYVDGPHRFHETDERVLQHAANALALSLQRARRDRELVEERDRAVAAEKAKSFFFSTVSHDIRTPLNAIIGFSQMLRLGFEDDAERDKAIDSIIVSGKTLLQLINDVLDLSKLEAGRMEILPDPVNCRRLVAEIVESFRASNTKKDVEVRGVVGPMPILLLDPQRVRQILFNLVGNAMKFTQKGYVEVRANYTPGKDESGTLKFEVRDTGCGISETDQEKIASPYVQVGRMGRHGGTGLGLAICRQLVTAMDGEIELSSKPGQGTTFYVKLTGVRLGEKVARERLSATQQMKVVVPVTPPKDVRRVLLADDSRINLSVIRAMLARIGLHDVVTASNGVDALKALRKDPEINFVLTDMWMPEMDGQTLVAEIRRNAAWSELPVYAVTADVEARNLGEDSGFTGVLLKPITFEKLKSLFI